MKRKIIIGIIVLIICVLLIPIPVYLKDGGTIEYNAILYKVSKVHSLASLNDMQNGKIYNEGIIIEILGKEIYNNVYSNNDEITNKYVKEIDNITIDISIPADWKYEEISKDFENDFYKYGLKIYKSQEDKYAILYYYHQMFGVCGTGRTSDELNLDNGNKAIIGYYNGSDIWQDISFYETNKYIAIINQGLDKEESEQLLDFIKTINIKEY